MDKATLLDWYRQMVLVRRFEQKCAELYQLGKIGGFLHLYIGQEAVAVGSIGARREQGDRNEPDQHDRPEECGDLRGATALNGE